MAKQRRTGTVAALVPQYPEISSLESGKAEAEESELAFGAAEAVEGDTVEEVEANAAEEVDGDAAEEVEGDAAEEVEGDTVEEVEANAAEEVDGDAVEEVEGDAAEEVEGDAAEAVEADTVEEVEANAAEEVEGDAAEEVGELSEAVEVVAEGGRGSLVSRGAGVDLDKGAFFGSYAPKYAPPSVLVMSRGLHRLSSPRVGCRRVRETSKKM